MVLAGRGAGVGAARRRITRPERLSTLARLSHGVASQLSLLAVARPAHVASLMRLYYATPLHASWTEV